MPSFFELIHTDRRTGARAGVLHTEHGNVPTPCFMPVGTQASVKTLDSEDVMSLDAPIVLANAYHLHLRPGEDTIARLGGLHRFMNFRRPLLTDSGGFQIFSLGRNKEGSELAGEHGALAHIDEEGVTFRSHLDGTEHRFTAESAMDIQYKLGADILMAFDECTPDDKPREYVEAAMNRTHRWAARSVARHQANQAHAKKGAPLQYLFGIIQGSLYRDLRRQSARQITGLPFDGIAIGGETTGFNMEATGKVLEWLAPLLPENKPRYTMGVGHLPQDAATAVLGGADMFDCVSPSRMARNGTLITPRGTLHIDTAPYKEDPRPVDENCACHTCRHYSRAYLHHLFKARELTAFRLATLHNLYFFLSFMRRMRRSILHNKYNQFLEDELTSRGALS